MIKYLYLVTLVIALVQGTFFPNPHQRKCETDALKRKWPRWVIQLTRSTSFLTLFSQFLLIVSLFLHTSREIAVVAMVLETVVFFLYHVFTAIDSGLLSYHDPEFTKKATAWLPSMDKTSIAWAALHLQHTVCPLHLWVTGGIEHRSTDVWWSVGLVLGYVGWNHFCWRVQGNPTYPIQQKLVDAGRYPVATVGFILLTYMVATGCDYLF